MVGTHVPPSSQFKNLYPHSRKTEGTKEGNLGLRQVINDSTCQRAKPSSLLAGHGIDDQAPLAFTVEQTYAVVLRQSIHKLANLSNATCPLSPAR